jgi:hypothetical protein
MTLTVALKAKELLWVRLLGGFLCLLGVALLIAGRFGKPSLVSSRDLGVVIVLLGVSMLQVWVTFGRLLDRIQQLEAEVTSLRRTERP